MDTTPADVPAPVSLTKGDEAVSPPRSDDAPLVAQPANPHRDIFAELLAEHPEWAYVADLRDQFKVAAADNFVAYEDEQQDLDNWYRQAWVRCTEHITMSTAGR